MAAAFHTYINSSLWRHHQEFLCPISQELHRLQFSQLLLSLFAGSQAQVSSTVTAESVWAEILRHATLHCRE